MDVNRATEILTGKQEIAVSHNGKKVWIDSVDATKQMARVHDMNNAADMRTVHVEDLQED